MSGIDPHAEDRAFLAGLKISKAKIAEILDYFVPEHPARIEIPGARVTVERVQIGGLEIELDANGRAGAIVLAIEDRAEVTEAWQA